VYKVPGYLIEGTHIFPWKLDHCIAGSGENWCARRSARADNTNMSIGTRANCHGPTRFESVWEGLQWPLLGHGPAGRDFRLDVFTALHDVSLDLCGSTMKYACS
jgi:hypothetical protein